MTVKRYKEIIERFGFKVISYKPGRERLYQVVEEISGGGVNPISPYMNAKEFRAWVIGFLAARGEYSIW